jgi:hypothetical protein
VTITTVSPVIGLPVPTVQHYSAGQFGSSRSLLSEVREVHRTRILMATALLTGIGAVTVFAIATIMLAVSA